MWVSCRILHQLFVSYLHPKWHIADLSISWMWWKASFRTMKSPMLLYSDGHRAIKSSDSRSDPLSGWLMVIGQDSGNLHQWPSFLPGILRFFKWHCGAEDTDDYITRLKIYRNECYWFTTMTCCKGKLCTLTALWSRQRKEASNNRQNYTFAWVIFPDWNYVTDLGRRCTNLCSQGQDQNISF